MPAPFTRFLRPAPLALFVSAIITPVPQLLTAQPFPYEQWVCGQGANGWECARKPATPGAYPQAPKPPRDLSRERVLEDEEAEGKASEVAPDNQWDYLPRAALTEEQRCDLAPGCRGAYVEPQAADDDAGDALSASAERSTLVGDKAQLSGRVDVQQGGRRMQADAVELDRTSGIATLRGNVVLRQPGELVRGSAASVNTDTQLGEVQDALFLHYASGTRATAELLHRTAPQRLTLEEVRYTQCTPDDESWLLSANKIDIDNAEGWGTAKHMVLRVADVPMLYLPYISFPIDDRRKSGLLWPSFANDSENGLDVAVPIYWNIAPNADATFAPRLITERGEMLEAEVRHLSGWGNWDLSGAFLENDDLIEQDRWLGGIQHDGRLGSSGYSRVDFTRVSDEDYFRDLNTTSLEVRRATHLRQQAELGYSGEAWQVGLEVLRYQTLDDDLDNPYQRMPSLLVERRAQGANFRPEWLWVSEVTVFDHRDAIADGGTVVTGSRAYAEPGVSLPMRSAWGFVIPSAKLRHVSYDLEDTLPGQDDTPATTAPLFSLDAGLIFERDAGSFLQTLEPRLYYVYSEFEEGQDQQPLFDTGSLSFNYSQLFRDRRFTGYDRLEDFDQASVGLTSRLIDKRSGRETLSASLGQVFYFDERQVVLTPNPLPADRWSNSAIAAQVNWQPTRNLWATSNILWESRQDRVQEGGATLFYTPEARRVVNLGYRYRRANPNLNALQRDLQQVDAGVALPMGDRWHLVARWAYDLDENSSLEELIGIEYDACCWRYRLAFQRAADDSNLNAQGQPELQRDNRVLMEFQLKGLGNIGDRIGSILEESIFGYRDNRS